MARDDSSAAPREAPPITGDMTSPERVVSLANWQDGPWNRWSYQHIAELIPSSRIRRDEAPATAMPDAPRDVRAVEFEATDGSTMSVAGLLDDTWTDGFLVLHEGRIAAEEYFNGMAPHTRHLLQSISKSITGALAGPLVGRGLLDPEGDVVAYAPELEGSAFEGATVRHVLDMTAGTRFSEDYDDPKSDIRRYEGAAGWRPPAPGDAPDLRTYIATLRNRRRHGGVFEYRSILTDLLGWIIERAGGRRFAELASDLLWRPLGAEWDAEITVDRLGGPMTDGGMSVTLRDLGRFGQLYLERGMRAGRTVLPAEWIDDTRFADKACRRAFARSDKAARYPDGHYRNQWWVPDPAKGVLLAAGIYGQYLYIDMAARVVVAKLSTFPFALDLDVSADHLRAFAAIAADLSA
jgi:CubicO group peptidase (beta-lactamase class C family)